MRKQRLVNKGHIIAIEVVGVVAENGRQRGHESWVVVFGVVGLVLDFVHEWVGVG